MHASAARTGGRIRRAAASGNRRGCARPSQRAIPGNFSGQRAQASGSRARRLASPSLLRRATSLATRANQSEASAVGASASCGSTPMDCSRSRSWTMKRRTPPNSLRLPRTSSSTASGGSSTTRGVNPIAARCHGLEQRTFGLCVARQHLQARQQREGRVERHAARDAGRDRSGITGADHLASAFQVHDHGDGGEVVPGDVLRSCRSPAQRLEHVVRQMNREPEFVARRGRADRIACTTPAASCWPQPGLVSHRCARRLAAGRPDVFRAAPWSMCGWRAPRDRASRAARSPPARRGSSRCAPRGPCDWIQARCATPRAMARCHLPACGRAPPCSATALPRAAGGAVPGDRETPPSRARHCRRPSAAPVPSPTPQAVRARAAGGARRCRMRRARAHRAGRAARPRRASLPRVHRGLSAASAGMSRLTSPTP